MQSDCRLIFPSLFLFITACSFNPNTVEETVTEYRDCENCPTMVIVPRGSFLMGSPDSEEGRANDEGPQHEVQLAKAFAMGKHEVTRGQFRAFVDATNYLTQAEMDDKGCVTLTAQEEGNRRSWTAKQNWRNAGLFNVKQNNDDHPVLCVSKHDALAYIEWLTKLN